MESYHSRPPERGAEGLKAPNMVVGWCCWCAVSLPPMGGFEVCLALSLVKSQLPLWAGCPRKSQARAFTCLRPRPRETR